MPFIAYVHAREPGPPDEPGRPTWQPNWQIWRWVLAGAAFAFTSAYSSGGFELLMVLLAFVCGCRAAMAALPSGGGMNEYRQ
jgi:hypothetical protein